MAGDLVKGAARAMEVFEALAVARGPLTLTELSRRTGIPVSSCHGLIRTLQSRGYLYLLDERKMIFPTKRLAKLGEAFSSYDPILERIGPTLRALSVATGETVILGKAQGDGVVYLDVIEGTHTIRFAATAGDMWPTHSSAIGKAVLSLMPERELTDVLKRMKMARVTDVTITDPDVLKADIVAGRRKGYFESRGETVDDVTGISIPRRIGQELYAIGVAGPSSRMDENRSTNMKCIHMMQEVLNNLFDI